MLLPQAQCYMRYRCFSQPPSLEQPASVKVDCSWLLHAKPFSLHYQISASLIPFPFRSPHRSHLTQLIHAASRATMADAHNLRSEAEILARQSRPQRNSTWTPKKRDWRYATGVFQHDDFDDAPNSRSVWDTLDYDYQADGYIEALRRSGSVSITLTELGAVESSETFHTPKSTVSPMSIGSWKDAARSKTACKPMTLRRRAWAQVKRFGLSESALSDHAEARYDVVGLVVRLHFMGKNTTKLREILEQPIQPLKPASIAHQNMMPPIPSPDTPATARTADTIRTPLILDSIKSLYTFPLFKRTWVDETYDFRVDIVREKLRPAGVKVEELGEHYGWYTDAVPIDAIFPPGVPLSAKEITAFYPHHVRWKGVMVRLTNNDYRGADIMGMQVSHWPMYKRSD
jgi:hypothetical protein